MLPSYSLPSYRFTNPNSNPLLSYKLKNPVLICKGRVSVPVVPPNSLISRDTNLIKYIAMAIYSSTVTGAGPRPSLLGSFLSVSNS